MLENHIIICGLGNIGFRTFELLQKLNEMVVVISDKTQDEWRWQVEEAGGIFFSGDARNDKLLIQAGISKAKAIFALTDQDIVNVSIIIDARNLNSKIKIIARMFDSKLGEHIAKAFNVQQIVSASEVSAPLFYRAIYQDGILGCFILNGQQYQVREESKYEENNVENILLGTSTESKEIGLCGSDESLKAQPTRFLVAKKIDLKMASFSKLKNKLNYFLSPIFSHFRLFLSILIIFITVSTVIIANEMSLSYINALYFVTTTVTTVGYGDFNFSHSSTALKLFGCILMLSGAAAIAILFSSITEILLSKRLPSLLGGSPVPNSNHVIVVGAGHVGHRIVASLIENNISTVIIEGNAKISFEENMKRHVALIDGNPRNIESLIRANVSTARSIISVSDDDVLNLSVSLSATKINPNIISIIQLLNYRLGDKLQAIVDINTVLNYANIAAPYFIAGLYGEKILLALVWRTHLFFLSETIDTHIKNSKHIRNEKNKIYISAIRMFEL